MKEQQEFHKILNKLTKQRLTISEAYKKAAHLAQSDELEDYFEKRSDTSRKMAEDLIKLIYEMGGKYDEEKNATDENTEVGDGSIILSGNKDLSDQDLLNETIRLHKKIVGLYEKLLTDHYDIPNDKAQVLKDQLAHTEKVIAEVQFVGDVGTVD
ncbi:MAG: hypothetical protein V7724_05400 [Sediminicola sp.]|tara:strand:- start:56124 stop:56588 length:465 start_codon:yes stop_codon:yes gene_type:complete